MGEKLTALVLTGLQNDFLPGGARAIDGANEVISVANERVTQYTLVVASQCWHPRDHVSFASRHPDHHVGDRIDLDGREQVLWPDHCIERTTGADFSPALDRYAIEKVFHQGTDRDVDAYSAFFDDDQRGSTGLHEFLQERKVDKLHVMGLATDSSVLFTVLDALDLGYDVTVLVPGCRAHDLTPGDGRRALEKMRAQGAVLAHE